MVSADFPDVTSAQRDKIYECLEKEMWVKYTNIGRDISTTWYASFKSTIPEERALEISKNDFVNCSKPYTTPKLALHFGNNKPTTY